VSIKSRGTGWDIVLIFEFASLSYFSEGKKMAEFGFYSGSYIRKLSGLSVTQPKDQAG